MYYYEGEIEFSETQNSAQPHDTAPDSKARVGDNNMTWHPGPDPGQTKQLAKKSNVKSSIDIIRNSLAASEKLTGGPLESARLNYQNLILNQRPLLQQSLPNETEKIKEHSIGFLQAGARFSGEQKNGRDRYEVEVELQHVDVMQSRLCGYLRIKELTDDHPNLCTFFEAEIIGPQFSFITDKWSADEFIDFQHWSKFPSFRPYLKSFNDPKFKYDFRNSDYIFMRWKEHFLVPDHKVRSIIGASFAGFYYVCYHRKENIITGYYFHQNSEWFQHLALKHVSQTLFPEFSFK